MIGAGTVNLQLFGLVMLSIVTFYSLVRVAVQHSRVADWIAYFYHLDGFLLPTFATLAYVFAYMSVGVMNVGYLCFVAISVWMVLWYLATVDFADPDTVMLKTSLSRHLIAVLFAFSVTSVSIVLLSYSTDVFGVNKLASSALGICVAFIGVISLVTLFGGWTTLQVKFSSATTLTPTTIMTAINIRWAIWMAVCLVTFVLLAMLSQGNMNVYNGASNSVFSSANQQAAYRACLADHIATSTSLNAVSCGGGSPIHTTCSGDPVICAMACPTTVGRALSATLTTGTDGLIGAALQTAVDACVRSVYAATHM